jgi:hypothetical protein
VQVLFIVINILKLVRMCNEAGQDVQLSKYAFHLYTFCNDYNKELIKLSMNPRIPFTPKLSPVSYVILVCTVPSKTSETI